MLVKKGFKQEFNTCWSLFEQQTQDVPSTHKDVDDTDAKATNGKDQGNGTGNDAKAVHDKQNEPSAKGP